MLKPDDGGGPPTGLDLRHIAVDLDKLADFRTILENELDQNLEPTAKHIHGDQAIGVTFGQRHAGSGVHKAQTTYRDALAASMHNLEYYVTTSQLLIRAIHTLTTTYRESDLTAQVVFHAIQEARLGVAASSADTAAAQ